MRRFITAATLAIAVALTSGCAASPPQPDAKVQDYYEKNVVSPTAKPTVASVDWAGRTYDVFAVMGQSNAQGWGLGMDIGGPDAPSNSIAQYAGTGMYMNDIIQAQDPLQNHSQGPGVGFAMQFAREYVAAKNRPVMLVPTAEGSTGFTPRQSLTWDPDVKTGTNLYDYAVTQIKGALKASPQSKLKGIFWQQGETDTESMTGPQYQAKLDEMIGKLQAEFPGVPILIGSMTPDWIKGIPAREAIDAVHQATPDRIANTAFVAGPAGLVNPQEITHYSAAGGRELGARYYKAYAALVP